jgi:hypothetical protein
MSQRSLIPTNLFFHWEDPGVNTGHPEPSTGDVYLNIISGAIRVFFEGSWHDAGSPSTGGVVGGHDHPQYLSTDQAEEQFVRSNTLIVSTDAPSGDPVGGVGTTWIQY